MFYYLAVLKIGLAGVFEMLKSIPAGKYRPPDPLISKNNGFGVAGPSNFYGHGIGIGYGHDINN